MREDTSGAALAGRVVGAWALWRWRAYERRGSHSPGSSAHSRQPVPCQSVARQRRNAEHVNEIAVARDSKTAGI